jgi:DNA-binding transcriptional MerR regulator
MATQLMTIGALAKMSGLSRTALLYYDRLGLLRAGKRTKARYRLYTRDDVERLERIRLYRGMGIPLKEIGRLLGSSGTGGTAEILKRRLRALGREIARMQQQQLQIVELLKQKPIRNGGEMINKDRWVEIMRAAGLSEQDMHNWHVQFEKMEPEAHQEFLESLGIKTSEIVRIREWARG